MTGKILNQSVRVPYTYMISVEDRLAKFLRRMSEENVDDSQETSMVS